MNRAPTASAMKRTFWPLTLLALVSANARALPQQRGPGSELAAKAEQATREGKYLEAAQAYEALLKEQPRSAELWSNLGTVRALAGDCRQALPALDRARSLNPNLYAPWHFSGLCQLQFHHDRRAVEDLEHAVKLNPRDANAWYLLAHAAGSLDELGKAFQAIAQALDLDPARPETYYLAGRTALSLVARSYDRVMSDPSAPSFRERLEGERDAAQGIWELAISSYRKAEELAPGDPALRFALGSAYLESHRFADAEQELRRSLEFVPESRWAKLRLAVVLAEEGKPAEARDLMALTGPESFEAKEEFEDYLALAVLLERTDLARQSLQEAVRRFPADASLAEWQDRLAVLRAASTPGSTPPLELRGLTPVGLFLRFSLLASPQGSNDVAKVFSSNDEYGAFRKAFLQADLPTAGKLIARRVEPLPSEPDQAFVLGEVLHWFSFRSFEYLVTVFPDSGPAQKLAAENFSAAGQQDKALEMYQALLKRDGKSPEVLRGIAKVYWTEQRWDDALKVLRELLEVDAYDPTIQVNVARIYSYRQDLGNAEKHFRRAVAIDPRMFEAHFGLGETLRRGGEDRGALEEFRAASQLEPENPRPHYALSQVYRRLGEKALADREIATFERLQAQAAREKSQKSSELVPVE